MTIFSSFNGIELSLEITPQTPKDRFPPMHTPQGGSFTPPPPTTYSPIKGLHLLARILGVCPRTRT